MARAAAGALAVVTGFVGRAAPAIHLGGTTYLDVRDVGQRFGLDAVAVGKAAFRLQSRWTRIDLQGDSQQAEINGLSVYLSEPVAVDRGRFFVSRPDVERLLRPILAPRLSPQPRLVRTVVVDAGHGGNDHGNENSRLRLQEKVFTLDVARRLEALLTRDGFKVVMTRRTDRRVELEDRVALAERAHADLFVSVHFNSFVQPSVAGAETFVLTPRHDESTPAAEHNRGMRNDRFPGNAFDDWNALLGYKVHRAVIAGLDASDRGLKRYRYYVLRMAPCPAVLVEAAFLSNDAEGRRVSSPAYRQRIASSIAAGVRSYADAVERVHVAVARR